MSAAFEELDFHDFHRAELPQRLASGNGARACVGARKLQPLAFRLPGGDAYTYVPTPDGVDVVAGDERAETVVELSRESWQGIVHELESPPGLIYGGRVHCPRGTAMEFVRWDPALRAMYTGRPIFDPATARLEDRHGAPLDVTRAFRLDDDPEDMAHFLRTAGYLLASSVFAADEIAAFREGAEAVRRTAPKGDKLSWWGKNARGEEVLCRVTNAGRHPAFRGLHRDPRVQQLVGLSDAELVARAERSEESVTVIFKNPDMTEGLSDIPWHRDCGMGGHAVMCPVLIVSIFIRPATAESGELRVLPGSWQGACGFIDARHKDAPKGIALAAGAGDVSLHYGDVMHAAPPPTGRGPFRESVVMAFAPPGASHHRGESSYNDVLHQSEDGQVEHLTAVAKRA